MPSILVIADQPAIRQQLRQIYAQGGFTVLEAEDSATAFQLAQTHAIQAVILSLQAQDTALQTCSKIATELKLPVIYVTTETYIDAALDAGASNVITNLHPRLLLHCTRTLLEAHETSGQRHLAEALRDTAAMLNSTLEIDTILDRMLTLIQDVIPSDLSTIYLIDGATHHANTVRTISAKYPDLAAQLGTVSLPIDEIEHLHKMIEMKAPMVIMDTKQIPSWIPYPPTSWVRSVLSAPLQIDGQVIGFIFLNSETPNTFQAAESETLQIFANQASIAIGNANRYQARSQHADEMRQQVTIRTTELEQKSSQLEAILESIGEGVQGVLMDENGGQSYSFSNSALFELFGYGDEDITSLDQLRPDDMLPSTFQAETDAIFKTVREKGIWKGERRLKRKDGSVVDTGLVVTGLKDSSGHSLGIVSIFRDLSQQKLLDAQKEQFVGHAAHELRNPIAALKLRLHLLEAQPDRLANNIQVLERIISHMGNLVEDMLDLTRFENGLIQLKDDVTEITSFVRETILIMESEAEAKNVWLIDRLSKEPVYVSIDQTRMMQVIMNLVSNAVKYTKEDHSVTISVQKGKEGTPKAGYMVMKIIDTGDGIAAEYLPYIFEPFYQVRTGGRGLGLGLAIIKEIVELHGGKISVESEVGKGTTFTVQLKLVDPPLWG